MAQVLKVLVVDDDDGDRRQIRRALLGRGQPFTLTEVATVEEAIRACEETAFDCSFVDYRLPGCDGLTGITAVHDRWPYMAIIMCTGRGDETVAVEAMKRGASDYIQKKEINSQSIFHVIELSLQKVSMQRKLDSQHRELEAFARVLAHDVREPMGAIESLALVIEKDIRRGKLDDAVARSQHIVRAASRSRALFESLFEFTRAESNIKFEPTEMGPILDDTLVVLKDLIHRRGAQVTRSELPVVNGYAPLMMQLLLNLISNAIKYCAANTPTVHVAATLQDGAWWFSVQDNGIGIPSDSYSKVFEPFHRLHSQDKFEGSGLGLATCRKIVERHCGRIWCESVNGQGTTFFFTLPAIAETVPAAASEPTTHATGA